VVGLCSRVVVSSGRPDCGPKSADQLLTTRVVHDRRVRREIANSNERKRMQSINAGFQSLRLLLPRSGPVDRLSKVSHHLSITQLPHPSTGCVFFRRLFS